MCSKPLALAIAILLPLLGSQSASAAAYQFKLAVPGLRPATCNLPWGGTLTQGQTVPAFTQETVPYGSDCASIKVDLGCQGGTLTSNAAYAACSMAAAPVATKTLDFDTWPSYDTTFFSVTGNSSAVPSWLGSSSGNALVTPAAISNGNFFVTFTVPTGATAASLSFNSKTDYPNVVSIEKKVGSTWTLNAVNVADGLTVYPLTPGTYRVYSRTGNGLNACSPAWCMNGKSYVDNVVVTYTP